MLASHPVVFRAVVLPSSCGKESYTIPLKTTAWEAIVMLDLRIGLSIMINISYYILELCTCLYFSAVVLLIGRFVLVGLRASHLHYNSHA